MEHVDMHTSLASQAHGIYDLISTLANSWHLMGGRMVLASGHLPAKYVFSCGPSHFLLFFFGIYKTKRYIDTFFFGIYKTKRYMSW